VAITDAARKLFATGVALLEDPDGARHEGAYRAFKAAYAESPSPKILYNLGLTAMKLERDAEAIEAFATYLEKTPDMPPNRRTQLQRDLVTLKGTVGTLALTVKPAGASVMDERVANQGAAVVNRYGPFEDSNFELQIRAGIHKITMRLEGHVDQQIEVELTPGQKAERTIELQPVGGPSGDVAQRPVPTSTWVMLGLTGALAVGTGVSGGLALSKGGSFADINTGADPAAAESARDRAQTLNIVTDSLLGATVVSAAVTAALYFTRPEAEAGDSAEARLQFVPHVSRNTLGLSAVGFF
jgi:hypothetical protein